MLLCFSFCNAQKPKGKFIAHGMAFAQKLNGPWSRMPEGVNPLNIVDTFAENHIVSQLKDGRYLMVFDSLGDQEIGYSTSKDGMHWAHEIRVKINHQIIYGHCPETIAHVHHFVQLKKTMEHSP